MSRPFAESQRAWSLRVSLSAPQTLRTGCKLKRTQFLALARFIGTFWCHPQRGGLTWASQGGPCTGQTPCGLPHSLCGMWLSQPLMSLFRTYRTSRKHLYCRIPRCILTFVQIPTSISSLRQRQPDANRGQKFENVGVTKTFFLVKFFKYGLPTGV